MEGFFGGFGFSSWGFGGGCFEKWGGLDGGGLAFIDRGGGGWGDFGGDAGFAGWAFESGGGLGWGCGFEFGFGGVSGGVCFTGGEFYFWGKMAGVF